MLCTRSDSASQTAPALLPTGHFTFDGVDATHQTPRLAIPDTLPGPRRRTTRP